MIVVLDSNIWMKNLYLRSPAGAAVQLYLTRRSAKIGLPEVVRREIETHLRSELRKLRDGLVEDHERLLGLVGELKELVLPAEPALDDIADTFFDKSGFDLIEVPFSMDSARDSFLRTIEKRPPSGKSQQFKDGVIWADCLRLAKDEEVILVSEDKAFFERNDYPAGLDTQLRKEAEQAGANIRLMKDLGQLLEDIREEITCDQTTLVDAIERDVGTEIDRALAAASLVRAGTPTVSAQYFASETVNVVYVRAEMTIPCEDATDLGRTDARAVVGGECGWNISTNEISKFRPYELGVYYIDPNGGEEGSMKNAYLYGDGMFLGHRTVTRTFRSPL